MNAAATLNCLGAIAEDQSAYAQAAAYYQRAVTIVDHDATRHGHDDEAAELLQHALGIFTRTLHDTHPHVLACREHLAALRCKPPG